MANPPTTHYLTGSSQALVCSVLGCGQPATCRARASHQSSTNFVTIWQVYCEEHAPSWSEPIPKVRDE